MEKQASRGVFRKQAIQISIWKYHLMLRNLSNMKREVGQTKYLFATCGQLDGVLSYMHEKLDRCKSIPY